MWFRIGAAVLVTLLALGGLELFGAGATLANRPLAEVEDAARGRPGALFWLMIFAIVVATSLLAAARRGVERVRRGTRGRG